MIPVIPQNEIVMFLASTGVLVFSLKNHSGIKQTFGYKLLLSGFYFFVYASAATILEECLFFDFFNTVEHICYTVSSAFVLAWCWARYRHRGRDS